MYTYICDFLILTFTQIKSHSVLYFDTMTIEIFLTKISHSSFQKFSEN